VYFSLLTLALAALTYTVAFRWSTVTGGEDGLGGLQRGSIGPLSLDAALTYYVTVALIGLGTLYFLLRLARSPFGHVLVAIRENQLRAAFQGYPVERYKLVVFVISAVVTGLAGALLAFQTYLVSAEAVSVPFSGELLAMAVIGGMRSMLGPALGALFFILFRELFSIWTANWLLWFGLTFVAFVLFSPEGLVGIWHTLARRLWPAVEEAAAMSKRRIYEGLPLPTFLMPDGLKGTVLNVEGISKDFGGIRAVSNASLQVGAGEIHALTAELVKFLGLEGIEEVEGGELSYGGQRLVDLGIALGSKPQVLLLDEPLAGLAAAERERVSSLVKRVAAYIPVLIVEHDIDRVLGFSQTVTVMNQGEVLMTGTPAAVRADRRVQEIYTGKGIPDAAHQRTDAARRDAGQILRFERVNTFYGKSHIL